MRPVPDLEIKGVHFARRPQGVVMTASYESLAVIEDFFGEELSADLISRFASMPNYQLRELLSRIDYAFKHGIPRRVRAVQGTSLSAQIAPFQPIFANDTNLSFFAPAVMHWVKCSLLYFPGPIAIPDPVGSIDDFITVDLALEPAGDSFLGHLKKSAIQALNLTLDLKPLIANGIVMTIPWPSVHYIFEDAMYLSLGAAPGNIASLSSGITHADLYEMYELWDSYFARGSDGEPVDLDISGQLTSQWLAVGSLVGTSPVAADSYSLAVMNARLNSNANAALIDQRVAQVIANFEIPGAHQATLRDVVRLRLNEEAFEEFRCAFREILLSVSDANPRNDASFSLEFKRHAYETLAEQRQRVTKRREASDTLQLVLTGAFLLGAAGIEGTITHAPPVGSALAGAATLSAWIISKAKKRSELRNTDELVRTLFTYLVPGNDYRY